MSRAPPSNCLFLPELPGDLTDSVLERHFRGFTGFSTCRTRLDRNGKIVGFVEFEQTDDAVRARESMQGQSPFPGINWHIHYSNNTKGTPKRPRDEGAREPMPREQAQRQFAAPYEQYSEQRPPPPPPPPQPQGYPQHQMSGGGPRRESNEMAPPPPQYAQSPPMGPMGGQGYPQQQQQQQPPPPPRFEPQPFTPQPDFMAMQLPRDASSTLYVEGLPSDVTEREISHIFRRFEGQGFQSLRMIARESSKFAGKNLYLCFVEFDNAHQACNALLSLQGYRVDPKVDGAGIRISFSKQRSNNKPASAARSATSTFTAPPPRGEGSRSHDGRRDEGRDDSREDGRGDDDGEGGQSGHRRRGDEHRDSHREDDEEDDFSEAARDDDLLRGLDNPMADAE